MRCHCTCSSANFFKSDSPSRRPSPSRSKSHPPSDSSASAAPPSLERHSKGPTPSALTFAAGTDARAEAAEANTQSAEAARRAAQAQRIVQEKGCHPYRVVLADVAQRLRNTKARMETLMNGRKPDAEMQWCGPRCAVHGVCCGGRAVCAAGLRGASSRWCGSVLVCTPSSGRAQDCRRGCVAAVVYVSSGPDQLPALIEDTAGHSVTADSLL